MAYEMVLSPREIMNMRWMKQMQETIPTCDFQDLTYLKHKNKAKQFAAEFSQHAY